LESKVLAEPVLIGREQELETLQRYLQSAKEAKGRTVFVSAEAGIGKTRLVKEFLDSVKQERNITILSGWCLFHGDVPYFPFIEAFSSYYSALGERSDREELQLNSWLKEPMKTDLSGNLKYLSPQALKDQTFAAVAKTIRSISAQNPVILLIEDIHWADSASLSLLHYISRIVHDSEKVLILATFRSEELASTFEGYPHPLAETLCMMRREDLFKEIILPSLNSSCINKIAENMLGGSLKRDFAEKLVVESEGNPLFVVESMRMLHECKNLIMENNEWGLKVDELEIPSKIKDIVLQRLAHLNHAQRRVLDAAAVIGEKFETGLLSAVLEEDSLDVLETLNGVANSTSLIHADENRYRFDHSRSREIVYDTLAQPLKQGYHNKIANILENSKTEKLPFADLAYHYAQAENKMKSLKYSLLAAKDELARWSNAEAIKHFEYVLKATENESAHINERVSALEGLGDAFYASSMFKEATETFELLGAVGTDILKIRALRKGMESTFQLGDRPKLIELLKKAEQYVGADRLENARVLMSKGRAFAIQTNMPASIENYKAALQVFEEECSLWDVGFALIGLGVCNAHYGKPKEGIAECLRAAAIFEELGDYRWQLEAYWTTGYSFGDFLLEHEALRMFEKVIEINRKMKMGDFLCPVFANAFSSRLFEQTCDFDKMLAYSLKALELAKKTDSIAAHAAVYSYLSMQYAFLGDLNHSEQYFKKLIKLPAEILSHPYAFAELAKIVSFAEQGKWKESNQLFNQYLESMCGSPGYIARGKIYYAWSLEKQGLYEEARTQFDDVKKLRQEAETRFEHADVQAYLMVRRKIAVDEEFEMRLDLINVARNPGNLVRVEGLIPAGCKVVSLPSFCRIKNSSLEMNQKKIDPFHVETIKLKTTLANEGDFKIETCVIYVDELGETRKTKVEPITVTSQLGSFGDVKLEGAVEPFQGKVVFKSEAAEKAFNFLVRAFEEDYVSRRLPLEKSGWRTLMNVVKNAKVSKHSMYGRSGRGGKVASELEHFGLVESRFFLGESGRGGRVLKVRIRHAKKMEDHGLISEDVNE
jgi:tetratricopeptide (TPR) repeat protein